MFTLNSQSTLTSCQPFPLWGYIFLIFGFSPNHKKHSLPLACIMLIPLTIYLYIYNTDLLYYYYAFIFNLNPDILCSVLWCCSSSQHCVLTKISTRIKAQVNCIPIALNHRESLNGLQRPTLCASPPLPPLPPKHSQGLKGKMSFVNQNRNFEGTQEEVPPPRDRRGRWPM